MAEERELQIIALAEELATEVKSLRSQIDALGGGYFEVMIWAEENAGIAANQDEWSFGNGAVGVIGIPSFWDCEAVGMVLDADTAGTSATVVLKIDGVPLATQFGITATGEVSVSDFATPLPINRGSRIGFRTTAVSGDWTDVRVGVVLRVITS